VPPESDNAELAASVGRISQAKPIASEQLDQKRQDKEAEYKRIEEERYVHGGGSIYPLSLIAHEGWPWEGGG
jgi:hypothetical protein